MTIQTRTAVEFGGGNALWQYTYNDADSPPHLLTVTCTNTSQYNTRLTAIVRSNGRTFSQLVRPVDSPFSQNVPTTAQTKLDISIDARGRVDGIDWNASWGSTTT